MDMSVEDAVKLVVSGGIVTLPDDGAKGSTAKASAAAPKAVAKKEGASKKIGCKKTAAKKSAAKKVAAKKKWRKRLQAAAADGNLARREKANGAIALKQA